MNKKFYLDVWPLYVLELVCGIMIGITIGFNFIWGPFDWASAAVGFGTSVPIAITIIVAIKDRWDVYKRNEES